MQATSRIIRMRSSSIRLRKALALAMASSVFGGKAWAVMRTWGKRKAASASPPDKARSRRAAVFLDRAQVRTFGHVGDRPRNARADRHDLDAGGAAPGAARDENGRPYTCEGIEHRAGAGVQGVVHQLRRKSFLVLEPAQAGPVFVGLVRNQAAVQIAAHDQAVVKAPAQGIARLATGVGIGRRVLFVG